MKLAAMPTASAAMEDTDVFFTNQGASCLWIKSSWSYTFSGLQQTIMFSQKRSSLTEMSCISEWFHSKKKSAVQFENRFIINILKN